MSAAETLTVPTLTEKGWLGLTLWVGELRLEDCYRLQFVINEVIEEKEEKEKQS